MNATTKRYSIPTYTSGVVWVALLILMFNTTGLSQKGWEVGGGLGVANYFGDLNTNYDVTLPGPNASALVRYNFNTRTAMAFALSYGLLRGDDAGADNTFQRVRNLQFLSHTFDLSAVYEFNFLPFLHDGDENFFSPYLFVGASVFKFTPRAKYQDKWVKLAPLGTEGQSSADQYFGVSTSFVFGFGFKYSMNERWSWNISVTAHKTATDYLDDVSTVYPNKSRLLSSKGQIAVDLSDPSIENEQYPNIGQEGYQRGNSTENDAFSFLNVSLTYYFSRIDCPNISDIY